MHQRHKYRGIKLLEHAMKVMERMIEGRLRKIVKIDNMQFGFMARKSLSQIIGCIRNTWQGRNACGWLLLI